MECAFRTIHELVENGFKIVESNSDSTTWLDYSQKIVKLATKDIDHLIHYHYLRLLASFQCKDIPAKLKIILCLEYLLEVLKILKNRIK